MDILKSLMRLTKTLGEKIFQILGGILVFIMGGGWVLLFIGYSIVNAFIGGEEKEATKDIRTISNQYISPTSKQNTPNYTYQKSGYDIGYDWAEENDTDNFDDCQSEFGTSGEENGCNEYVKENYTGYQTFGGYECTEDCSGHEAGYEWAEEHDISDSSDCEDIDSSSFSEGCQTYVDENY